MEKVKCLIVDDEPVAHRILEAYLSTLDDFELTGTCLHTLDARIFLESNEIDLMFLDIEMPVLPGLHFLKSLVNPPKVILTTAHRKYALEGYELAVVDYLLKPIPFDRFLKAINHFKTVHYTSTLAPADTLSNEYIYVKSNRKTLKIRQQDILFIEGMNNYIKIHCMNDKVLTAYYSIQNMLSTLDDRFIRIHKSFAVNKNRVSSFSKEAVEISEKEIPVGRAFRKAVEYL